MSGVGLDTIIENDGDIEGTFYKGEDFDILSPCEHKTKIESIFGNPAKLSDLLDTYVADPEWCKGKDGSYMNVDTACILQLGRFAKLVKFVPKEVTEEKEEINHSN